MPFQIVRNDITKMNVDAIVNAANNQLLPGGGVCGAIHEAAGPALAEECAELGGCATGHAKATGAYALPCRYVIHTVGPVWQGGECGEREALTSCYSESLKLAKSMGCESIAFPLISSGIYGYPKKQALKVAIDAIGSFLMDNDMNVFLAVFNKECLNISKALFTDIEEYIDENYVDAAEEAEVFRSLRESETEIPQMYVSVKSAVKSPDAGMKGAAGHDSKGDTMRIHEPDDLEQWLDCIDESFSEMVLRKIKEKGMTNAQCYKKANIDKKLFSKIKGNKDYHPKKNNALALAVALELSIEETDELLRKAGMALSHSSRFDIIVEYFIIHRKYDIFEINEVLFSYDQPLLGGAIY